MTDTMQSHHALLQLLAARFDQHMQRHPDVAWPAVLARLSANAPALAALDRMEATGGAPDVVGSADAAGAFLFCDCAPESPAGRRSLCYDNPALAARKTNKPAGSALALAGRMGAALLTEEQYRALQALGEFDLKTSSWIMTPPGVRKLGGALFCDRRYGRVFTYHNGAESYYAARGFRTALRV
jgi:hypothetical protein